jgi:hypothetical protein
MSLVVLMDAGPLGMITKALFAPARIWREIG